MGELIYSEKFWALVIGSIFVVVSFSMWRKAMALHETR